MIKRRDFIGGLGVGAAATMIPASGSAATNRVVVIGGGMAGAAVAKYLRLWSNKTILVTLVAPATTYVSNIMSNLVLTGQNAYSTLNFDYAKLKSNYGIVVETATALEIAGFGANATGTVKLSNGKTLTCERVVLAPGIKMDPIPLTGSPATAAPVLHAWQAGQQTLDLQRLLLNMPTNGVYVMSIPPKPYRCPPGPYERACVVADYLRRNKPGAKIVVLDANPGIVAEPVNFGNAFKTYIDAGVLQYVSSTSVVSVSAGAGPGDRQFVTTNNSATPLFGDVVNIIPPHRAPDIVSNTGLVPPGGAFAPVDVRSYESTIAGKSKIHVLGDASDTSLPKAGHVANQEAKICAAAIIAQFAGATPSPAPTANSACFSPIDSTQASWLTAVYQYSETQNASGAVTALPANKRMVIWNGTGAIGDVQPATEADAPSTKNFGQMTKWYGVLMSDTFA
ncbi:MAG: FAD-dependent oxidoreductase [Methylocystis sp.]|uniref:FAD-dependent oxidoreductase n=1 Tax=Methylocystis sp. TaxID=1911079 RepID=UPI003DA226E9